MHVDAERARKLAEGRERGVVLLRHDRGEQLLARALHDVGHLGRLHVVGAAGLGLADQLARRHRCWPAACGPERIWIRPTRNVEPPFMRAASFVRLRKQRIELAVLLERVEFVAAADMGRRR